MTVRQYFIKSLNLKTEIEVLDADRGDLLDNGVTATVAAQAVTPNPRRVVTHADLATVTPDADTTDIVLVPALSQGVTIANPTGTPVDGQQLMVRMKSASTQTVSWGNKFRASTDVALLTDTVSGAKWNRAIFEWNAADSKWDALATNVGH